LFGQPYKGLRWRKFRLGNHQALVGLTNEIALFPKHAGRKSATAHQLAQNVQQLLE
jgi:hypothetical protein